MVGNINFYSGKLGHEHFLCSCDIDDLIGEPSIGDMVLLPFNVPEDEQDMWIVKQKYITKDEIACFCKLYDWEN